MSKSVRLIASATMTGAMKNRPMTTSAGATKHQAAAALFTRRPVV
jgi:hypothetical protein